MSSIKIVFRIKLVINLFYSCFIYSFQYIFKHISLMYSIQIHLVIYNSLGLEFYYCFLINFWLMLQMSGLDNFEIERGNICQMERYLDLHRYHRPLGLVLLFSNYSMFNIFLKLFQNFVHNCFYVWPENTFHLC